MRLPRCANLHVYICLYVLTTIVKAIKDESSVVKAVLSQESSVPPEVSFGKVKDDLLNVNKPNSEVAFLIFDANDDGKISPLELRSALRAFGYPLLLTETKALLDNFDTNMNYVFERSEFFYMLKTMGLKENENVKTFWKQHDILIGQAARVVSNDGMN